MNNTAQSYTGNAFDDFRAAMAAAGVPYSGNIQADTGKIQRFTVDGDRKGSMTGWYLLFTDGIPAGEFGCWKRGVQSTWCAKTGAEITSDERRQIDARRAIAEKERQEIERQTQAEAAQTASLIWDAAEPCDDHPYLTRKGVQSYGLRLLPKWRREFANGRVVVVENALIVPVRQGKKIVSIQAIFPSKDNALSRDKDFLPGGRKRGCYYPIGAASKSDPDATIVICEGYATGASIHAATGFPCIVAFDAGNLVAVAEYVRAGFPGAKLIIAADNDQWTLKPVENPGVHFATRAASAVGGILRVPSFADTSKNPTDFNDLHAQLGLQAVADQVNGVTAPEAAPAAIQEPAAAAVPAAVPANDNVPATAQQPRYVDWFAPFPDINGKGKPIATIENVYEACQRLGVTVRYNVIKKDLEIMIPDEAFTVDNKANASLAWMASACNRFGIPGGQLGDFLAYIGDKNLHNPVANWITSKPWDGVSRLNDLYNTITADGEEGDVRVWDLKAAMMRRWLISAVAAAFNHKGVSAHGVLVLQGEQYLGKTKWFKTLVPEELGVIADGLMLRTDDKDSVKTVVSNWLVELGELDATFRKSDIAALKAFLTKDRDILRRPYAKLESEYARRTVFFASVNPRQFLHDPTGNRRYWTISATAINHDHGLDMQQVWAEVYQDHYLKGEPWYLTPDEMAGLNSHNRDHEVLDPIRERLLTRLDWQSDATDWRWATATDIMLDIGFDKPTRADVTHCGQIVQELNAGRRKKSNGKALSLVPPKIRDYGY